MKISKLFALGLFGTFLLNSCSSDDDGFVEVPEENEKQAYEEGVIILNEGSQAAGTVSFLDWEFTAVENNIFATVNEDMDTDLGMFTQSIFFDEDHAYIISNGSNLITVVDRYTFEYVGIVDSGLNTPYYGVAYNGKAYVSNYAEFDNAEDDFVAIIDLETLEVESTVVAEFNIEEVKEEDGLIFFEGTYFGAGNSIKVFDPSTNTFTGSIDTNDGLNSFEVDDNLLYALSSTQIQQIDITSGEEIWALDLPEEMQGASNLQIEDRVIYFTSGTSVYAVSETELELPTEALFSYESSSAFGAMYGFAVEDGYIYTSDGGDFASAGTIEIYTTAGDFVADFSVGVGPNSFYFND